MANAYTLSMTKITNASITIGVADNTTILEKDHIKIKKYDTVSSTFVDFDTFELSTDPEPTVSAAIILPSSPFIATDKLLIQIDDETNKSDTVIVDYDQLYTNLESEYELKLPLAAGNYILKLDNVINENFSDAQTSSEFTLANDSTKPIPTSSSIEISRPDLVHFTDETLEIKVILDNIGHNVPDGGYQVSFSADLQ